MNKNSDLRLLKEKCPMPELLHRIGLGRYAKPSCPSPFRPDTKPSWGIFQHDGLWYFKDFATDEKGDELSVLARHLKLDEKKDFRTLVQRYREIANLTSGSPVEPPQVTPAAKAEAADEERPNTSLFYPGTTSQLERLSAVRGISMQGLRWAQDRGVLVFGLWRTSVVYGVKDALKRVMEIRKLDGSLFDAVGDLSERKSHAIKHSQKNWPVGIQEAFQCPRIMLLEGIPDFLAAHQVVVEEGRQGDVAPVAMLCASVSIAEQALPYFKGKHVRVFPHADEAGVKAARKWSQQLKAAGVAKMDFFDFARLKVAPGERVKDLCDLIGWRKSHPEYERKLLE